jgi:hypothetical protein
VPVDPPRWHPSRPAPPPCSRDGAQRWISALAPAGAPVEDILTAHVMAGLDWDTDVLEKALKAVSGSINSYAAERRTFDRPGSRHPLQVCNGATA